jgi:ketosteroid isomerase-like protein
MSQENAEIVRRMYEATNRGDADAAREALDPEIEIHLAGVFPDLERLYRGHAGVRKWVEQTREPWEELLVEPDRVIDLGARVLVLAHFHVKGRDGIEVQRPVGHLWTMRNGQAVRMDAYSDHQKALKAAGLSE